jgi:hypothetical protein
MEPLDAGDEDVLFKTRWSRIAVTVSAAIPVAMFAGIFLEGTLSGEGGEAYISVAGGPRIPVAAALVEPISFFVGAAIFGSLGVGFAMDLLRTWRRGPGDKRRSHEGLAPDEQPRWTGRLGVRSLTGGRVLAVSVIALTFALFGFWFWSIASGSGPVRARWIWALLPALLFFGSVVPILIALAGYWRTWICDLFGTMAITDRRIVWISPRRQVVYRQIPGDALVAAALVERDAGTGWVAVTKQEGDSVSEIDLVGLPQPDLALAAIERLLPGAASDLSSRRAQSRG